MRSKQGTQVDIAKAVRTKLNGKTVALADLPLVAYLLNCGHTGRDFAIEYRDLLFCSLCQASSRVRKILAK